MGGKKKEKKVKEPRMSFSVYQQQNSTTLSLLTTAYSRDFISYLGFFHKDLDPSGWTRADGPERCAYVCPSSNVSSFHFHFFLFLAMLLSLSLHQILIPSRLMIALF